jgi:uncharacterized protein YdeI (YjbR/CyaY-like superfamily)
MSTDPRIDEYVAKAAPFAQPILTHLRELVHKGCPGVQEAIKWSRPFFEYRTVILCNMSAFKAHCTFGFWGTEIGVVLRAANVLRDSGMGSLGRLTSVKDLPPDKQLLAWIRQAAAFVDSGRHTSMIAARRSVVKPKKATLVTPEEFTSALEKSRRAAAAFAAFSPSCKREYIEWIAGAKRPETRVKRITAAIELIEQGKQLHWQYQT